MPLVGIIDYAMGNLQSVANALHYLGAQTRLIADPGGLDDVSHVVLPGVGAFPQGMAHLRQRGLIDPLREIAEQAHKPVLGICLGMQLLADRGEEGEPTDGLGLIPGVVERLSPEGLHVPHMGWNTAMPTRPSRLFEPDERRDFYFVHSYFFKAARDADVSATCDYGEAFPCAVQRGKVCGIQFHPEKSHGYGLDLIKRFLDTEVAWEQTC